MSLGPEEEAGDLPDHACVSSPHRKGGLAPHFSRASHILVVQALPYGRATDTYDDNVPMV